MLPRPILFFNYFLGLFFLFTEFNPDQLNAVNHDLFPLCRLVGIGKQIVETIDEFIHGFSTANL
jgi:hypothetical protein